MTGGRAAWLVQQVASSSATSGSLDFPGDRQDLSWPPLRGASWSAWSTWRRHVSRTLPCQGRGPARSFDALRLRRRISLRSVRCRTAPSGFSKDRPSVVLTAGVHSRDLTSRPCERSGFGPLGMPRPAAHAFRPRGFAPPRRLPPPSACGLVASRSRPWGSSGFRQTSADLLDVLASPPMRIALQSFPHPQSRACRHRRPLPSCRCGVRPGSPGARSTSRPCSLRASVARGAVASSSRSWLSWASRPGTVRPDRFPLPKDGGLSVTPCRDLLRAPALRSQTPTEDTSSADLSREPDRPCGQPPPRLALMRGRSRGVGTVRSKRGLLRPPALARSRDSRALREGLACHLPPHPQGASLWCVLASEASRAEPRSPRRPCRRVAPSVGTCMAPCSSAGPSSSVARCSRSSDGRSPGLDGIPAGSAPARAAACSLPPPCPAKGTPGSSASSLARSPALPQAPERTGHAHAPRRPRRPSADLQVLEAADTHSALWGVARRARQPDCSGYPGRGHASPPCCPGFLSARVELLPIAPSDPCACCPEGCEPADHPPHVRRRLRPQRLRGRLSRANARGDR